jgi:hypothetical protein
MKDLLLLLCQYPFKEHNRDLLSKLIDEVQNWHKLVELINAHGIIALAAYNIKESGLERNVPQDSMAILENGLMKSIARNTWLTERWKEVNTLLCEANIKPILLKGMALEHTLYGSRGLRQMNDNDILIKPGESVKAWELLQKNGFMAEPLKSPLFKKMIFDYGQHLPAIYKNGYALEIHTTLFDRSIPDESNYEDPFSDAIEITIKNTKVLILSKEMQSKYLMHHFVHHTFSGDCQLRLYTDIKLLDDSSLLKFPDRFISDPMQGTKKEYRKPAYKARIRSINPKYRLRFLIGDTFPTMKWMKERYKCNTFKALITYPLRIGKLKWLF